MSRVHREATFTSRDYKRGSGPANRGDGPARDLPFRYSDPPELIRHVPMAYPISPEFASEGRVEVGRFHNALPALT